MLTLTEFLWEYLRAIVVVMFALLVVRRLVYVRRDHLTHRAELERRARRDAELKKHWDGTFARERQSSYLPKS